MFSCVLLIACASRGVVSGAYKAFANSDYYEAIRKVDRALNVYPDSYSQEQKAQLIMLKADSLSLLGETSRANSLYQQLAINFSTTQAGISSSSFIIENPELEFIVSQQLSIDEGETKGLDTCESLAKQKATEYFGVTLESEATIRESYQKNNDVETSQTEVESSIISSAKAKVKLTSLKQTARHQKGKILVHCVYKAVKYQTAKDQNGIG
ncbi:hypothetical protein XM47_07555 [Catenovulum maritimum]|uniref:Uncharacterized protein n=2 Tax=Catenovulum maritimum TaxID=1513271 RepID=A0A0J8GRY4_9ALTE|nr:hypothetical protein XM47_07555 [Catenovulum maritimum]